MQPFDRCYTEGGATKPKPRRSTALAAASEATVWALDSELAACATAESVAWCVLAHARQIMSTVLGNVQLIDWKIGYLEIVAQQGFSEEFLKCFERVHHLQGSACGRAILKRKAIVIHDVWADDGFVPYRDIADRARFRSVQSTPIISSSGALYGVVSTHDPLVGRPSEAQLHALEALAMMAANRIVRLKCNGRESSVRETRVIGR